MPPTPLEKQLYTALHALMSNPHICLGDQVYRVRENEGKGWEGRWVKQWWKAVEKAEQAIVDYQSSHSSR